MVIAGGLILELSGETSNDACGGRSRSNTIFCALTSSINTYTPDENLIDLDAMEAGESRDIELKEEIDSSSLFLGKSMFLKYGKTTIALLFGDWQDLHNLHTVTPKMIVFSASMTMTKLDVTYSTTVWPHNIIW